MANIHGAMVVCEKRIRTKWETLNQNRAALDLLCAPAEHLTAPQSAERRERLQQLLTENRRLLQEIETQYQALSSLRNR